MRFLLDMDGVCVDFLRPAVRLFLEDREAVEQLMSRWPIGEYSIPKMLNATNELFWLRVDSQGSDFWRYLPEFLWFNDMYTKLSSMGDVYFCTTPSFDAQSLVGKMLWLHDRFGRSFRNYVLTEKKFLLANKDTILIDDSMHQCEPFRKAGGKAILFPAVNNINRVNMFDPLSYVLDEIDMLASSSAVDRGSDKAEAEGSTPSSPTKIIKWR